MPGSTEPQQQSIRLPVSDATSGPPTSTIAGAAEYLKDIGRGHAGSRSLSVERAHALFTEVFAGRLAPVELGALMMALRMKGESVDEVQGALQALDPFVRRAPVDTARPVVSIPSYNGARNVANLTPLLACLLADNGVQVIVHGVRAAPNRTTTMQILQAMGIAPLHYVEDASDVFARYDPVFLPVELLSPALARLLDLRRVLGVRNIGHTLAKLINPTTVAHCLRMVSFTHPEFDTLQHQLLARCGANALVMRGTEGEVVANTRRKSRIDWLHHGITQTVMDSDVIAARELPSLPDADAQATAYWIRSVLAGESPVPQAVAQQVELILRLVNAPAAPADSARDAVLV
jgi:anthranilate phosphoribosyltransferase